MSANGQSVTTDNRGQFVLDNTPVGSNRLQFDNGARGSVNVDTKQGMELNVAVTVNGQSATVICLANRPLGDTNAANACDIPGDGGNNGNKGTNGDGSGDNGGNGGGGGGGNNGGSNGGGN